MDNLTHSLTGLALARAGLDRICPRATLLLIISANIPDCDIVGLFGGPLKYLEVHRGYTHSLLLLPAMALLSVGIVALLYRERLLWTRAWLLCCIGVASHLMLDWTNAYGIRLLLPFSSAWLHLDVVSLWDLIVLAVLLFAALWPMLAGLVSQEIGAVKNRGRGVAIFALAFFLLWDLGRGYIHDIGVAQLNTRLYGGEFPARVAVLPSPIDPLHWRAIVQTAAAYRIYAPFNPFQNFEPELGTVYFKPAVAGPMAAAMRTEPFRYFAYFARFPLWTISPASLDQMDVTRVELTDLRYGNPGQTLFRSVAFEDKHDRVIQSRF
ncbi:MAG TPA: metal-dependent hydrolase [Bryobacteraceae bacterium]|jgi:inner membrane protein|nr:metal-dependent hydrolase [Bryobacteraceae bacterium]